MNVEKLRELQKFIQIEPRRFSMREGLKKFNPVNLPLDVFMGRYDLLEMPPCETAVCLAGEAILMTRPVEQSQQWGDVKHEAKEILDLTYKQADRLFHFNDEDNGEPEQEYINRYNAAKTPKDRVQVAVDFIDHFIKTEMEAEAARVQ